MKYYPTIIFLALLMMVNHVSAQTIDIFGGLNSSSMKHKMNGESQDSKWSSSFQVGVGVVVPLNKSYYKDKDDSEMAGIYPSLQYIRKGAKRTTLIEPTRSDIKLNYWQLTIPFYMRATMFGIGLGPYAALASSGKTKFSSVPGERKINFGSGATDDLKGLDYGLSFTMSISFFYLQYDYGMANLGTGKYGSAKNRNFNVGILIPLASNHD